MKKQRHSWNNFVDSLERAGGAIIVLVFLLILFVVFSKLGIDKAEDQIPFILGALIGIITGKYSISRKKDKDDEDDNIDNDDKTIPPTK